MSDLLVDFDLNLYQALLAGRIHGRISKILPWIIAKKEHCKTLVGKRKRNSVLEVTWQKKFNTSKHLSLTEIYTIGSKSKEDIEVDWICSVLYNISVEID